MNRLRYLIIQLVMILPLAMWGQASSDEYDPPSPGDPTPPTIVRKSTLTLKALPEEGGSVSPSAPTKYEVGSTQYVSTSANSGYVFLKWEDENGATVSTERSFRFIIPEKDTTLFAVYEYNPDSPGDPATPSDKEPKYPLTAVITPEEGGSVTISGYSGWVNGGSVPRNREISLTAVPAAFHEFAGWADEEGNRLTEDAVYSLVMPGNALTLHANFNADPNSSRVSIKASPEESGTVRPSGAARYQKGSSIGLTASANSGFKFLRWDDSDGNTVATTTSHTYTVPDHDIELTAVFEYDPASPGDPESTPNVKKSTLTVRFNPENAGTAKITRGTTGWSNGGYIGHGSEQTITTTAQGHRRLVNWTSESGEVLATTEAYTFTMPEKDLILTANFEEHYDPTSPGDPSPGENDDRPIAEKPTVGFKNRKIEIHSSMEGATVRYTIDGSNPTETNGTVYTAPFLPEEDGIVKAVAFKDGYRPSYVGVLDYIKNEWRTARPVFNRVDNSLQLSSTTEGAQIYYIEGTAYPVDGNSNPVAGAVLYNDAIPLSRNITLTAAAVSESLFPSDTTIYRVTDLAVPDVAFKFEKRKLNLECTLQGVTIRYTTDGSKPTVNSGTVYTGGFVPATDCTVKAAAFREGYVESNVTSFDFRKTDWTTVKPEFKRNGNQLSLSCTSEGSSIYYMEGTGNPIEADFQPAANAKLYSTPITLTENMTFSAAAITDNLLTSETASFTVNDFVVAGLDIAFSRKQIHITCEMEDAKVRYTTDGSIPSEENGSEYTSPFLPDTDCTVRAVALRDGYNPSNIASFVYIAEEHTVPRLEIVPLFIERKVVLTTDNHYDIAAGDSIIMNGTTILREGDTFRPTEFPTEIFPEYAEFEWKSEELLERGPTGIPIQYATPPSIEYDGERVSIESQEGCYTIVSAVYDNGTETGDETQGGAIYTLQPETTGQIECLSYADGLFLSDPALLAIHALRNEDLRTVTLNSAGWMRQAFPAGAPQDWELITVKGPETSAPIDNDDLALIADIRALNFIDLKNTAPLPSSVTDFSELSSLMRLSLPATEAYNCTWNLGLIPKLSALQWNSDTQMAGSLYGQSTNPNMLLYVDNKALAPDEADNVVCDGHSDLITLTAGHPFCLMDDEITASKVSLTKHFDKETSIGTSMGWETIVTPFDVDEITHRHETAGERQILPFEAIYGDDPTPGFWLATPEANTDTWTDFSRIQRGIPYIIAMPNDNEYLEEYNIRGDVIFTGHDVEIRADLYHTDFLDAEGNIRRFAGSYTGMERSENVFALTETDNASIFAPSESEVLPFECWFDGQPGMSRIAIGNPGTGVDELDDASTGVRVVQTGSVLRIETDTDTTVRIVGMSGASIRTVATRGHEPAYVDAPTPGIYIIANRKFIVK